MGILSRRPNVYSAGRFGETAIALFEPVSFKRRQLVSIMPCSCIEEPTFVENRAKN